MTEQTHTKTKLYRRWNISRTQKNGWTPNDLTISATYEEGRNPDHEAMVTLARTCIEEAQQACDELNNSERQIERIRKQEPV